MKPSTNNGTIVLSTESKPFTGATFKTSLRLWQSRYRAEKAAQANAAPSQTGGMSSSAQA